MNEQNLPENTKNEVKETAVPVVPNRIYKATTLVPALRMSHL